MNKHQAEAISQMAENLYEYNRGVLSMLGKDKLAWEYISVCGMLDILREQKAALMPQTDNLFDQLTLSPDAEAVQVQIDETVARRNKVWAQIQVLIDEARAALDAADPLGLDQYV